MNRITLTVLCEGQTERNFVVQVLAPHLRLYSVFAKPIILGGSLTVTNFSKQVNNALGNRRDHEHVTTMIDLYRIGTLAEKVRSQGSKPRDRGLDTLRIRCPHFGEWLTKLERLAGAA